MTIKKYRSCRIRYSNENVEVDEAVDSDDYKTMY